MFIKIENQFDWFDQPRSPNKNNHLHDKSI